MHIQAFIQEAEALLQSGRLAEAEALCAQRLEASPPEIVVLKALANLRSLQRRLDEALEIYAQIRQIDPSDGDAWYIPALFLKRASRFSEALPLALEACQLQPQSPEASGLLGVIYYRLGRFSDAVPCFRRTLELQPEYSSLDHYLGMSLYRLGEYQACLPHLRNVSEREPENQEVQRFHYKALLALERFEEALRLGSQLLAHHPDWTNIRDDMESIRSLQKSSQAAPKLIAWPSQTRFFQDYASLIRRFLVEKIPLPSPFLQKGDHVLTFGSCFAQNISLALKQHPLKVEHAAFNEEANSTYANRYLFEWIAQAAQQPVIQKIGEFFGESRRLVLREQVARSKLIVMTVGVGPCFFEKQTGSFVFMTSGSEINLRALADQYEFRQTSLSENVENMERILSSLRAINPHAHIFLTLSPVPLRGVFGNRSAILEDCISKSTLRLAIETIQQGKPYNVHYWPAFEMIRWLGAHLEQSLFGKDDSDSRHVNEEIVVLITKLFIECVGDRTLLSS